MGHLAVRPLALALIVAAVATPQVVHADARPVRAALVWEDAHGCLDADVLVRAVERQLGHPVFLDAPDVQLVGRVTVAGAHTEIELTLQTVTGQRLGVRTLRATRRGCRALDRELVLIVSLLLDLTEDELETRVAQAETAPSAVVAPPPAPEVATSPERASESASEGVREARRESVRAREAVVRSVSAARLPVALLVGAGLGVRTLPGLAMTAKAGVELTPWRALPIELSVGAWLPRDASRDAVGATLSAWFGRAGLCGTTTLGAHHALELGTCAALDGGVLIAAGYGLAPSRTALRPWLSASLRLRLGARLGPVSLRFEPGVSLPFVRDRFVLFDGGTAVPLYQSGRLAGVVEFVVALHLEHGAGS